MSPEVVASAAYQIGRGAKYEREKLRQDDLDKFNAQMRQRSLESAKQYALEKQRLSSEERYRQDLMSIRWQEMMNQNAQFLAQLQQAREMAVMNQEARLQEQLLRNKGFLDQIAFREKLRKANEPEYTPAQRRMMEELQAGEDWVRQKVLSGEWSEEEGKKAMDQLFMSRFGIQPPEKPEDLSPEVQFYKNLVVDKDTGDRYLWDGRAWKNIDEERKKRALEELELKRSAASDLLRYRLTFYKEMLTSVNPSTGEPFTREEVDAIWKDVVGETYGERTELEKPVETRQELQSPTMAIDPIYEEKAPAYVRRMAVLQRPEEATPEVIADIYTKLAYENLGKNARPDDVAREAIRLAKIDGWDVQ